MKKKTEAQLRRGLKRMVESIKQTRAKKGRYYKRYKLGMDRYADEICSTTRKTR